MNSTHMPLPAAAATAYRALCRGGGNLPQFADVERMLGLAALALSTVMPIYSFDPIRGGPRRLTDAELARTRFERGGAVLADDRGYRYIGLTVVRDDVPAAIRRLEQTRVSLEPEFSFED
jgi:hypothetical protein